MSQILEAIQTTGTLFGDTLWAFILGGFAFGLTCGRPEVSVEPVAGAPAVKSGVIEIVVEDEAPGPLG